MRANPPLPINKRVVRVLAWVALVLGAIEFVIRSLVRTRSDWISDFAVPYLSTKLWLQGANPYDRLIALPAWYAAGGARLAYPGIDGSIYSVYPPPTLAVLSPLGILQWHAAFYAFIAIGLLLYTAVVYGLVRLGWPQHRNLSGLFRDSSAMFFVAFAFGFAPIHTAFHSMNIVLFSCCAAIFAALALLQARPSRVPTGLLIVVAIAAAILIKPTTGIFMLPWLVRERRWRYLTWILAVCATVTIFSLAVLLAHQGLSWLPDYRQNVTALFTHGGNADVSAENLDNTDRIDLQLIAFAASGNRSLASATSAIVYLCLLGSFLAARWIAEGRGREGERRATA